MLIAPSLDVVQQRDKVICLDSALVESFFNASPEFLLLSRLWQVMLFEKLLDCRLSMTEEVFDDEFDFIRDQLLRERQLARLWGFRPSSKKRRPEQVIRALAEHGDPARSRDNAKLARQPIREMA